MAQHIDESGADHEARSIDHALGLAFSSDPMAAMRSPRIAISPAYHGFPVPSRMWPWRMSTS